MRSYRLHIMAIVAIACVALQGVDCRGSKKDTGKSPTTVASPTNRGTSSSNNGMAGQHHDCTNYKSEIWNKAFQHPNAMKLAKLTFESATKMGKNEVCADTVQTLLYFFGMMTTNENMHNMIGMFTKMVKSTVKLAMGARSSNQGGAEPDKSPMNGGDKTLKNLILRAIDDPSLNELIVDSFNRFVPLLVDPVTRNRLFKMIGSMEMLITPSKNESMVKNTMKKYTDGVNMARNALRNFVL